jgi:hypothetical protein
LKIDTSIKNQIIAGIAVLAIAAFASWFYGLLPKIGNIIRAGISFLGDRVVMPRWYYYLLLLCGLALLVRVVIGFRNRTKIKEESISSTDYQRDTFFGIVWRWDYFSSGEISDEMLAPYCPTDDTLLVKNPKFSFDNVNAEFYCETCKKVFTPREGSGVTLKGKVIRQIDRKIRVGEWRELVKSSSANH